MKPKNNITEPQVNIPNPSESGTKTAAKDGGKKERAQAETNEARIKIAASKNSNKKLGSPVSRLITFDAKSVSLWLAVIISLFSGLFLFIAMKVEIVVIVTTIIIIFFISFFLIFLATEFLIFREINKIYAILEKLRRKKDIKVVSRQLRKYGRESIPGSPFAKLNNELMRFASRKEEEIVQLKAMEVYRREFISSIGHELKTPLFASQSYVHTLLDGASEDPETRERFLKKAAKSLDGLQELVEDFLDLSEMEAGVVTMRLGAVDIGTLISDTIDLLEGLAEKRAVKIQWEKNTPKTEIVLADPKRMQQVLINLLENGVKYGRENGNIFLGLETEKDQVTISVRDDGPGIDQDHLKRIFERFYRVEQSRNRAKGGSGLGLAIVKHILELHGSKVQVVSKLNKGTTFSFKLKKYSGESLPDGNPADLRREAPVGQLHVAAQQSGNLNNA